MWVLHPITQNVVLLLSSISQRVGLIIHRWTKPTSSGTRPEHSKKRFHRHAHLICSSQRLVNQAPKRFAAAAAASATSARNGFAVRRRLPPCGEGVGVLMQCLVGAERSQTPLPRELLSPLLAGACQFTAGQAAKQLQSDRSYWPYSCSTCTRSLHQ